MIAVDWFRPGDRLTPLILILRRPKPMLKVFLGEFNLRNVLGWQVDILKIVAMDRTRCVTTPNAGILGGHSRNLPVDTGTDQLFSYQTRFLL